MSSESSSGDRSSSENSSDGSSFESHTHSLSGREQMVAQSLNNQSVNFVPDPSGEGGKGPLCEEATDETNAYMEILEDGEEGKTAVPMLAVVAG